MRSYLVEDDGDSAQLHLVEAGQQIGGAFFPFAHNGEDSAYELANLFGIAFVASARPRSAGLSQSKS